MAVALLRRAWLVYFFFVAIFLVNVLLFAGLLLRVARLLSDRSYRRLANFLTGTTWCFYPRCFEEEAHGRVVVYGTPPPTNAQHVLVMANHVEAPDWSIVFWLACAAGHLSHLKVFAKKSISYVPLIGTGMRAMGTVFLSRSWENDKSSIERTFAHLRESGLPYWLLTHPEGTRATPRKIAESVAFARTKGLPELQHVLLPRTKGLVATMAGLRGSLDTVLDVTLCWDKPAGPLPFFFLGQGGRRVVHCHLREFRVEDIPTASDELLIKWIYDRWREKNDLVGLFKTTGGFGSAPLSGVSLPHAEVAASLGVWQAAVALLTGLVALWLLDVI